MRYNRQAAIDSQLQKGKNEERKAPKKKKMHAPH